MIFEFQIQLRLTAEYVNLLIFERFGLIKSMSYDNKKGTYQWKSSLNGLRRATISLFTPQRHKERRVRFFAIAQNDISRTLRLCGNYLIYG